MNYNTWNRKPNSKSEMGVVVCSGQHALATVIGIREIKMSTYCANKGSKQSALLRVPRRWVLLFSCFVCLNKALFIHSSIFQ